MNIRINSVCTIFFSFLKIKYLENYPYDCECLDVKHMRKDGWSIVKSTCYFIKFWSNINEYWESIGSAAFEVVVHICKFHLAQGAAMLLRITSPVWVGTTNQAIGGKVTQWSRVEIRIGWRQDRELRIFNTWIREQINYRFLIDVTSRFHQIRWIKLKFVWFRNSCYYKLIQVLQIQQFESCCIDGTGIAFLCFDMNMFTAFFDVLLDMNVQIKIFHYFMQFISGDLESFWSIKIHAQGQGSNQLLKSGMDIINVSCNLKIVNSMNYKLFWNISIFLG